MSSESLDDLVEKCNEALNAKKSSISSLLSVFGKLVVTIGSDSNQTYEDNYVKESQFAIVYKYISDEKKSDRMTFRNNPNTNAMATDFINGLDKYLRNVCHSILKAKGEGAAPEDVAYVTNLSNELKMIRSKSGQSLAQSLSPKINDRYDNSKALITAIYDALQRGVSLSKLGQIFSQTYSLQSGLSRNYGSVMPKYREYLDRQKAINNFGK